MRRYLSALLAALALVFCCCSPVQAASSPSLAWEEAEGALLLTLQGLDGSGVYAAQLELTLEGSWPDAGFTPSSRDLYSVCQASEDGDITRLTVCLSAGSEPLGTQERLLLGTLDLGGRGSSGDALPSYAQLILLGRG